MSIIDRYFIKQPKFRRFVTRILEGDKDRDVELLGASIRVNSIKENGYLRASRMIQGSSLLRDELAIIVNLSALITDGDTFVDIGANVGIYSHTLSRLQRVLSRTRFYAFEANPDTFLRLSANIESQVIHAHNVALSDHNGTLEFVSGAVSHVFTTTDNASAYSIPSETVSVPCRRLDEMEIEGDSLILKIDVEGQEKNVLVGALGLFQSKRIKAVYLDGYSDTSVDPLLREHGFKLLEGRTLQSIKGGVFSLLAIRELKI